MSNYMKAKALTDKEFNRISKALADPIRLQILEKAVAKGRMSCHDVCEMFPVTNATISHHTKELFDANLVERRKEGQFVYFEVNREVMDAYLGELQRRFGQKTAPKTVAVRLRAARPTGS
jgi:ArsR family transcriptional regulator